MQFTRKFEFDAAHTLSKNFGEKEAQFHGHRYRVDVTIEGSIKEGMVVNLSELKRNVQSEIIDVLDHNNLNNYIKLPSVENIAIWIWDKLRNKLSNLAEIRVYETPNHWVTYKGEGLLK